MSTTFFFCNSLLGLNSFSRLLATCISSDALTVHWRIPFPDVQNITPMSKHHDANANQSLVYFFHWKLITFILRYEGPFVSVIPSRRVAITDLLKITYTWLCPTLCTVFRWTYVYNRYTRHSGTDSIIQLPACQYTDGSVNRSTP
jgi:hypothetical protein